MYIINCDLMIFLMQIGMKKLYRLFISLQKDTQNDVITSIDSIANVYFFIF